MRRSDLLKLVKLSIVSLTLIAISAVGHAAERRRLTVAEVQSFGRGLTHWMDLRARCGEGARFQGSRAVVRARIQAFRTAASSVAGLAPSGSDVLADRGLGDYNPLGLSDGF